MHAQLVLTTLLSLSASTLGAVIVKARAPQEPAASSSDPSSTSYSPYAYTLTVTSDQVGTQVLNSDAAGSIWAAFYPGDVVRSVSVANPADNAACVARDAQGNQVRAFGGPDQYVDSVNFEQADGKQIRTIQCLIVA